MNSRTIARIFAVSAMISMLPCMSSAGEIAPDFYEPDNTFETANFIYSDEDEDHPRNFHNKGDEDWVKFDAIVGNTYIIKVVSPGLKCDAAITLFSGDGKIIVPEIDIRFDGQEESVDWKCTSTGKYFARIRQAIDVYGEGTQYYLKLYQPSSGGEPVSVCGKVMPSTSAELITKLEGREAMPVITDNNGNFCTIRTPGSYTLTTTAEGYEPCSMNIDIPQNKDSYFLIYLDSCLIRASAEALPRICIPCDSQLNLHVSAEYQEQYYDFMMNFYQNPSDSAGIYWKLNPASLKPLSYDPGNCMKVENTLALDICAEYQGNQYAFKLNYDNNLIWKMDIRTFELIP